MVSKAEDLERFRQLADEQLLQLDAELDPAALEVLYERHHVLAYSFAVRIVGSRDNAQDIVHDAFWTSGVTPDGMTRREVQSVPG